jgi:hypothetical protein
MRLKKRKKEDNTWNWNDQVIIISLLGFKIILEEEKRISISSLITMDGSTMFENNGLTKEELTTTTSEVNLHSASELHPPHHHLSSSSHMGEHTSSLGHDTIKKMSSLSAEEAARKRQKR